VPLLTVDIIGGGDCCGCITFPCDTTPTCGATVVVGDDDGGDGIGLLLTLLVVSYGAEIVALLVPKGTLLLFVVATCCLGLTLLDTCVADPAAGVVAGDATDIDVVGDEGNEEEVVVFFTVFGILQMRASVVLTTFKPGLLGLHSSALSLADIVVVLGELADGDDCDDSCCPYALKVLARVAARAIPNVSSIPTSNLVWFISNYVRILSIYKK
jgi:hypothetical protein